MYINWAHFYIPKLNGLASFVVNPYFIWITLRDKSLNLGDYRWLLTYFSVLNMLCSVCDVLVPIVLHDYGNAFTVFVATGCFATNSAFNNFVVGFRCSCISATYAILHTHFIYRFMVLYDKYLLSRYFLPYGIMLSILYTALHMAYWIMVCLFLINADIERREYVRMSYYEEYGTNVMEMNMLVALYNNGSTHAVRSSWIGILAISTLSIASILFLFFLRRLILRTLETKDIGMSPKTRKLQRDLMRALTAQAIIPTVVSFSPSIFAWYQPVFAVNLGKWLEDLAVIAISIFPYLDPLAVIYFVPNFRKKLVNTITRRSSETSSKTNSVAAVSNSTSKLFIVRSPTNRV